jgi:hypothetical protein
MERDAFVKKTYALVNYAFEVLFQYNSFDELKWKFFDIMKKEK